MLVEEECFFFFFFFVFFLASEGKTAFGFLDSAP
jgi:hypothetical protein